MKIKITKEEKNIKGNYKKKVIVPYGHSARIPERKNNIGKNVYVIYPEKVIYSWVLSKEELNLLLDSATKNLNDFDTKHSNLYKNAIKSIESDQFTKGDIMLVLDLIIKEKSLSNLYQKINEIYLHS